MTYLQQLINTFLTLWPRTATVMVEMSEEFISPVEHGDVREGSEKMGAAQSGAKAPPTYPGSQE